MLPGKLYAIIGFTLLLILVGVITALHRPHEHNSVQRTATAALPGAVRYLPLGDSYTIGQSVAEQARWPNQLVAKAASAGIPMQIVANPSVTGYTTQDLIDKELPLVARLQPDFVTILIGVNDFVQGVDGGTFERNLTAIIGTVQAELPNQQNILLVTIPDFGKTPTGAQFGEPSALTAGIAAFNGIITKVAASKGLATADIFAVSQAVAHDPSLIAADGLHPSAKQYAAWTDVIFAAMQANKLPHTK